MLLVHGDEKYTAYVPKKTFEELVMRAEKASSRFDRLNLHADLVILFSRLSLQGLASFSSSLSFTPLLYYSNLLEGPRDDKKRALCYLYNKYELGHSSSFAMQECEMIWPSVSLRSGIYKKYLKKAREALAEYL